MSSRPLPVSEASPGLLARLAQGGPFGFGASSLGNLYAPLSDGEARAAVDAAWDCGVRYFDTAPFYGFGLSEQRLGAALRDRPRGTYLLSTKAGRLLVPAKDAPAERDGFRDALPYAPVFDYSYDGVMRSFEASLERLGLDRIDILYLHDLGAATHGAYHPRRFAEAVGGGFRALRDLREQGAVAAIGLGVNETAICEQSLAHADFDLFLIANRFTLLDASAAPFFDTCRRRGIGVVAAGVFSSGILAVGSQAPSAMVDYAPASAEMRARVARIEAICAGHGVPLAAAALQFVARHPAVTLPLVGIRDAGQAREADRLRGIAIPPALWEELHRAGVIAEVPSPA